MQKSTSCLKNAGKLLLFLLVVLVFGQPANIQSKPYVPESLEPWVEWVLHNQEERLVCVPQFDNSEKKQCSWPSELELKLNSAGGEFTQTWLVQTESWVSMPGNTKQWPLSISVDGQSTVVLEKDGVPKVKMQPGTHVVNGKFTWPRLPENIVIPAASGLVTLHVNGKKIGFPNLDNRGRLWLKSGQKEEKIENRLKIDSFRMINDQIPAKVTIYFTIDVAGAAREITLGPLYDPLKFTPLLLNSSLPARLEQDGRILVQVRPGRYVLNLQLRYSGALQEMFSTVQEDGVWPAEEIWSFQAQPDLRLVEIEGGVPIDPLQTSVPEGWKNFPAFRVKPGDVLRFKEIKRGDPHPAPDQLTLNRDLWLRFDGSGYTIKDTIVGKKNTNWRLEIDPAISLGRVAVDGSERFITKREGASRAGVELRNGGVDLVADSLYIGKIKSLPATGWAHDFQKVNGTLYLPPGWKLVSAKGMDHISRTWIKKWTLLDFFILLIFTIAVAKLYSKPMAVVAFITLLLLYHEPDAPCYIWLALLLGFTLLKYLPDGKFKNVVKGYQVVTIVVLIMIIIPYSIQALRIGIYPQLEKPRSSMTDYAMRQAAPGAPIPQGNFQAEIPAMMDESRMRVQKSVGKGSSRSLESGEAVSDETFGLGAKRSKNNVMQYDPKTVNQTGPGLPRWQPFETIPYSWSGPVTSDQSISFTLIGPGVNLVLAFVRVFLIILLSMCMFSIGFRRKGGVSFSGFKSFFAMTVLALAFLVPNTGQCAEIPSQQILDELQARLLAPDECFPNCADISEVKIEVQPDTLEITAKVDASIDTAIPLPGHAKQWLPQQILMDETPAAGLIRVKNNLWVAIPAGNHEIRLMGPLRNQNTLQLPFPLKPHKVVVHADGWSVEGVHGDGTFDSQLQFKRVVEQDKGRNEILETGILPPFIEVERTLLLGLVWKIETRIKRLTPAGSAVVLNIPLIAGESVTSQGIRVEDGVAKINLGSAQTALLWESFLDPTDIIILDHSTTDSWIEIWKVDISPIFHMEYEGIPVIHHKIGSRWHPTWHPWPGEKVQLKISRPSGIAGQTMTIENSHLRLHPGQRSTAANLKLTIKSSQGGQHVITLPLAAKLQEVKVNGRVHPIRQEGDRLSLPIVPGSQDLEIKWIEGKGMSTHYQSSEIDLGVSSVNTSVDVYLPSNRWPLFIGGEQLVGPAVLFWSVVFMIFLVALGLSLTRLTPLRFYHWFLLGIGMSMSTLVPALCVVGWLLALDFRKKANQLEGNMFNLVQVGIIFMTVMGVSSLVFAISNGLLGHPDMNIVGNGSSSSLLRWYHDVSASVLPKASVFSIPLVTYRIAMLLWALWVSFWLVSILKWGWNQFITPQLWKSFSIKPSKKKVMIEIDSED